MLVSVFIAVVAIELAVYGTYASWKRISAVRISRSRNWQSFAGSFDRIGVR